MDILSQFLVSSSVNRWPLLAAPPVRLALPAPRRAGLLTAGAVPYSVRQPAPPTSASQDYLIFDRPPTWDDIDAQLACPSLEDMDAEILTLIADHREAKRRQYAARPTRPTVAVREV